MANIDQGFSVDVLSLGDNALITSGAFDPSVTGYEAPLGSLFLYNNGSTGTVLMKSGPANTDWTTVSSGGPSALNDLTDVTITTPSTKQVLLFDGTQWVNSSASRAVNAWDGKIPPMSGTSVITPSAISPSVTNGTQLWSVSVTPTSDTSRFIIQTSVPVASSNSNRVITIAAFRNNAYIGATMSYMSTSSNTQLTSLLIIDTPNTRSTITYQARIGINSGTWYVNRRQSEITFGGLNGGWSIIEVD